MTIFYGVCECCLNCIHRAAHINNKIMCDITNTLNAERIKCSCYKRTVNNHILSAEKRLVPQQTKSQTLFEWAEKNGLVIQ